LVFLVRVALIWSMRWRSIFYLTIFAGVPSCCMASEIPERAVSIDVTMGQRDDRTTVWRTEYGSYRKDFTHQRVLRVRVRVHGSWRPDFTAQWIFIGADTANQNKLTIYGRGERNTRLGPGGEVVFQVESPVMSGTDSRYTALKRRDREGIKPYGWAVLLWQSGRLFAAKGATPELESFARKHAVAPIPPSNAKAKH
jgi:hypothetical protein